MALIFGAVHRVALGHARHADLPAAQGIRP